MEFGWAICIAALRHCGATVFADMPRRHKSQGDKVVDTLGVSFDVSFDVSNRAKLQEGE